MTHDARQVANWFVERAKRDGRTLSIMSLLKLTYIAHGWHLEMRKTPLFHNRIEAWQYGPVIRDVYDAFRVQGVDVSAPVTVQTPAFTVQDLSLFDQIYDTYGKLAPFTLSELTHEVGGPWHMARKLGGWYADIPNELIQQHYEMKRMKHDEVTRAKRNQAAHG